MMLNFLFLYRREKIVKPVLLKRNCKISAINEKTALFLEGQAIEVSLWKSHYAAFYSTVRIKDFDRESSV